jgi:hypothetical protein
MNDFYRTSLRYIISLRKTQRGDELGEMALLSSLQCEKDAKVFTTKL